jgi:hypothetical protein
MIIHSGTEPNSKTEGKREREVIRLGSSCLGAGAGEEVAVPLAAGVAVAVVPGVKTTGG